VRARLTAVAFVVIVSLIGCGSPQPRESRTTGDPVENAGYAQAIKQLTGLNREAEDSLRKGQRDAASAALEKGKALADRLLAVRKPTLAAMEAASEFDDLYGRMLLSNRHYGWARLLFQKNQARWKNWIPQTPETDRRRKLAESQIAECDRHIETGP
jgi:hypothetical protein